MMTVTKKGDAAPPPRPPRRRVPSGSDRQNAGTPTPTVVPDPELPTSPPVGETPYQTDAWWERTRTALIAAGLLPPGWTRAYPLDWWNTAEEVAQILHISKRMVLNLIEHYQLPASAVGGHGMYLVRWSDLNRYMDEQKLKPAPGQ